MRLSRPLGGPVPWPSRRNRTGGDKLAKAAARDETLAPAKNRAPAFTPDGGSLQLSIPGAAIRLGEGGLAWCAEVRAALTTS